MNSSVSLVPPEIFEAYIDGGVEIIDAKAIPHKENKK